MSSSREFKVKNKIAQYLLSIDYDRCCAIYFVHRRLVASCLTNTVFVWYLISVHADRKRTTQHHSIYLPCPYISSITLIADLCPFFLKIIDTCRIQFANLNLRPTNYTVNVCA